MDVEKLGKIEITDDVVYRDLLVDCYKHSFGSHHPSTYTAALLIDENNNVLLRGRNDFVIIGSTDMSHYLSYHGAKKKDSATIKIIENFERFTKKSFFYFGITFCFVIFRNYCKSF